MARMDRSFHMQGDVHGVLFPLSLLVHTGLIHDTLATESH